MGIEFKSNWLETKQMYNSWLHGGKTGRPLLSLTTDRDNGSPPAGLMEEEEYGGLMDRYLNMGKRYARAFNHCCRTEFLAESYPQVGAYLGAGSMAIYLGSEPVFREETVWFTECIDSYEGLELKYDAGNKWWKLQIDMIRQLASMAEGTDIIVGIPDIVENIDIISAMRGPYRCCFDLYDHPEGLKKALRQITELYPVFYNQIYDIVKKPDGSSSFGPYNVYGDGKSAKLQCDFNALMSPAHFDEFVMPCLMQQCSELDNTIFHLDGVECIVHLDSLLSIGRLGAIQWTPPAGPSEIKAANSRWFDLYRRVRNAGKGLWLSLAEYGQDGALEAADKIIREIGPEGLYLQLPHMDRKNAEALMLHAERDWKQ